MSIGIHAEFEGDTFTLEVRLGKVKLSRDELQTLVGLGTHMLESAVEDKKVRLMIEKLVRGYSI